MFEAFWSTALLIVPLGQYLFTFVYNMPKAGETGGRFFPKAVTHLFVGIYIEEICLCALFFLGTIRPMLHERC